MGSYATTLIPVAFLLVTVFWVHQDASVHTRRGTPVYFSAGSIEVSKPATWALAACACGSSSCRSTSHAADKPADKQRADQTAGAGAPGLMTPAAWTTRLRAVCRAMVKLP